MEASQCVLRAVVPVQRLILVMRSVKHNNLIEYGSLKMEYAKLACVVIQWIRL
jgi:hypothetical protein